jgi:hypothetical protein
MKIDLCSSNCVCFGIFSKLLLKRFFNILDVGGFSLKCDVSFKEYLCVLSLNGLELERCLDTIGCIYSPLNPKFHCVWGSLPRGVGVECCR